MAQTIKIKRSSTSGNKLTSSNSVAGELGLNTADKALYIQTGSSNGDVVTVAHEGTLKIDEVNNRVGIGNTSPTAPLTVQSQSNAVGVTLLGRTSDNIGELNFASSNGTNLSSIQSRSTDLRVKTLGNIPLTFHTVNAERMRITSAGNVGIGTTSPSAPLHIAGDGRVAIFGDSSFDDKYIELREGGTAGLRMGLRTNLVDSSGCILLQTGDDKGFGIAVNTTADWGSVVTSSIPFYVAEGGNVGIGTTTPAAPLHVKHASGEAKVIIQAGSNTSSAVLQFGDSLDSSRGGIEYTSTDDMAFSTNNMTEAMRIRYTGNVGIGTSSPDEKLEVNGSIFATPISYAANQDGFLLKAGASNSTNWDGMGFKLKSDGSGVPYITVKGSAGLTTMTWKSGSVGIGIEDPTSRLHVVGTSAKARIQDSSNNYALDLQMSSSLGKISTSADLALQPGGVERVRFKSDGKVGIGEASPDRRLHVKDSTLVVSKFESANSGGVLIDLENAAVPASHAGAYAGIRFYNSSGFDMALSHITESTGNGYVQIGDSWDGSSTILKAHSSGAVTFNDAFTLPTSDGSGNQVLQTDGSGNVSWASIAGVGTATTISDADGDTKIQTEEGTDDDTIRFDTAGTERARIGVDASSDSTLEIVRSGVPAASGKITFNGSGLITDATSGYHGLIVRTGGTERLRVKDTGDVGIGTTSPLNPLHVKQSNGSHLLALETAYVTDRSGRGQLSWRDSGNITGGIWTEYDGSQVSMRFGNLYNSGYNTNTSMIIRGNGNVGIGTTSPSSRLNVVHSTNATNGITVQNATTGTGARSNLRLLSDAAQLDIYATSSTYSGVSSWADAGVISTSSNASGGLIFNAQATGHIFQTSTTERMRINSNGNVGINQTNPSHRLQVSVDANGAFIKRDVASNAANLSEFNSHRSLLLLNRNSGSYLAFGGNGSRTDIQATDLAGTPTAKIINLNPFGGNVGIGTTAPSNQFVLKSGTGVDMEFGSEPTAAFIQTYNRTSSAYGHLRFVTNGETMRLTNTGNVGIGTTSPGHKLTISDTSGTVTRLQIDNTGNATAGAGIYLRTLSSGTQVSNATIRTGNNGDFSIWTGTTGEGQRLTIDSTGRVGIGTTSPNNKLTVTGAGDGINLTGSGAYLRWNSGDMMIKNEGSYKMGFYTYNATDVAINQRMVIDTNGKVGIGTTTPQQKLTVRGATLFSAGDAGSRHGTEFNWVKSNTGSSGNGVWYKVADITLPNTAYSAMSFEAYYETGLNNFGSHNYLDVREVFVSIVRNSTTSTDNSPDSATLRGRTSDIRVYKTAAGTYELQARHNSQNAKYAVRVRVFQTNGGTITPKMDGSTAGTNSGGTEYTVAEPATTEGVRRYLADIDSSRIHLGNVDLYPSGNSSYIHVSGSGVLPPSTTASSNGSLGTSTYLWNGVFSRRFQGEVSSAGAPTFTFSEDSNTGMYDEWYIQADSKRQLSFSVDGTRRMHLNEAGVWSAGNFYLPSTGASLRSFHTYTEISNGTSGNGFRMRNSADGVDSLIVTSAGNGTFAGSLTVNDEANIGHATIDTNSTTTSATTQVAIDTMAAATFRSAEFTIQVTNSTDSTYHLTKVLLIHDGTTPGITEYGTVFTGGAAEATFNADISSGNVRLLATPASTDSMTFKVVRHCITV